ncbi:unnamed protein product [Caenorhabditis sp. 36 PRJEB53466]|nr:unnamed protein product [Caenorhabditis sp. 36 PRJEB53466]
MRRPIAEPCLGCPVDEDPLDYISNAWKSVPEINRQNEGQFYLVPITVLRAQTQIVAGFITMLKVLVGESTCQKSKEPVAAEQITAAKCTLKEGARRALYDVQIYEKPWKKLVQITATKIRDVADEEKKHL